MTNYYMVPRARRRPYGSRPLAFNGGRRVPLDVHVDSEEYIITAAIPGLKAEDLNIEILDDVITLKGEIKPEENGDGDYLLRELHFGSFKRSIRVSDPLDSEKAEARIEDGLLTVRIPKSEEAKPKTIKVNID